MHDATQSAGDNHPESEDVEDGHDFLTEHLENLHLTDRCLGRSSGVTLIHHVQEMKLTHSDANHERPLPHIRHRFWRQNPVCDPCLLNVEHSIENLRIITVATVCTSARET